jgi:hypothetical protein
MPLSPEPDAWCFIVPQLFDPFPTNAGNSTLLQANADTLSLPCYLAGNLGLGNTAFQPLHRHLFTK